MLLSERKNGKVIVNTEECAFALEPLHSIQLFFGNMRDAVFLQFVASNGVMSRGGRIAGNAEFALQPLST